MPEASVDDALIMRQLYRAHATLFVCAYAGLLGYFAVTDPNNPVAVLFGGRVTSAAGTQSPVVAAQPEVAGKMQPMRLQRRPPRMFLKHLSLSRTDGARQEESVRLRDARLQATSAQEPQQRAQGIDQLNTATPETLQALQAVVTSDSAVRNRIRALNSLRAMAERIEQKDAVISIVHLAMVDSNASVAARAGEVYRELTQEQAQVE